MVESSGVLRQLIELNRIDGGLTSIVAERHKLEAELAAKENAVRGLEGQLALRRKRVTDRRAQYEKEEKALAEEREKLTARRKGLETLNNYKLQQAADREIQFASKQVEQRNELLLPLLTEIETTEGTINDLQSQLEKRQEELRAFAEEARATLETLGERQAHYMRNRDEVAPGIDKAAIALYDKVRQRHPMDALARVHNNTCAGCFQTVGPQVYVQVMRGNALVRCPGCGRILYVEESQSEAKPA